MPAEHEYIFRIMSKSIYSGPMYLQDVRMTLASQAMTAESFIKGTDWISWFTSEIYFSGNQS
jgi:hypothetical protein